LYCQINKGPKTLDLYILKTIFLDIINYVILNPRRYDNHLWCFWCEDREGRIEQTRGKKVSGKKYFANSFGQFFCAKKYGLCTNPLHPPKEYHSHG